MKNLPPADYIETDSQLAEWVESVAAATELAIDTEADSFHHYREKVCLIQVTALGRDVILDPLKLESLESLRPIFGDPTKIKIFHDAGYDLIGLGRDFGFEFAGLFDTMLASRLLGERNFGLAAILADRFDFEANKRLQRSDWARRPLSAEQIAYARFDTHFLPRLAAELRAELQAAGRWAWAEEDFGRLPETAARLVGRDPSADPDAWWRIKGVKELSPVARGRARALHAARDKIASRLDRPPFKVFGDAVIIDLATSPPKELNALHPRKGLRRAGVERFGAQIMRAIRGAEPIKGRPPPGSGRRRRSGRFLDPSARKRFERLRELRLKRATEIGIDPEVALGNATLETLAREPPASLDALISVDGLNGWRREVFADAIMGALRRVGKP